MPLLASYAASEQGQLWGALAERYGVDPAAGFSDEVLAMNFRYLLASQAPEAEPEFEEKYG